MRDEAAVVVDLQRSLWLLEGPESQCTFANQHVNTNYT